MNIADVIAIIIVCILVFFSAKKGFVKSFFSLGSFVISLALALVLSPIVSDFLENGFVGDYVRESVQGIVTEKVMADFNAEGVSAALPLPKVLKNSVVETTNQTVAATKDAVASSITSIALTLLSILAVFVLVKVAVWLLSHILDLVSHLPVIRTANRLLGGLLGAIYGVLILYVILAVLTFGVTVKAFRKPTELVLESKIVSVMYHQNVLLNFLQ